VFNFKISFTSVTTGTDNCESRDMMFDSDSQNCSGLFQFFATFAFNTSILIVNHRMQILWNQ